MALIIADRVLETSTTTGTGAYTLAGAVTGYRAASAVCADGDTFYYYAEDVNTAGVPIGAWEIGVGTWGTGGILTRTTIVASTNAGFAVSWAAGTRRIALALTSTAFNSKANITNASFTGTFTATGNANNNITLTAGGTTTASPAGNVIINAAQPTFPGATGGNINITAAQGSSTSTGGPGGAVNITGGASAANSAGGGGGAVNITGGIGNTLNAAVAPGAVTISAGAAQIAGQAGASINISASNAFSSASGAPGGNVNITAGTGTVTAGNGRIILTSLGQAGGTTAAVVTNVSSTNGEVIWQRSGTEQLKLTSAGLIPSVTNNISLGTSSLLWSNVYSTAANASYIGVNNTTSTNGYGISLYNGATAGQPTYGIMFQGTATFGTHGSVTADWATYFTMNNTANRGWIFKTSTGTTGNVASIDVGGTAVFNGNVTAYSDIRLKKDIVVITDAVDKVKKLRGVTYTRTDSGERHTGIIAQELLPVLPEAVLGSEATTYSVAYGNLVGLLVEAIKEQQTTIKNLESRIAKLENP